MAGERKVILTRLKRHGNYEYKELLRELDEAADIIEVLLAQVKAQELRITALEGAP